MTDNLVPKGQNLQVEGSAGVNEEPERRKQRDDDGDHGPSLCETARHFNQYNAYCVSGRHSQGRDSAHEQHETCQQRRDAAGLHAAPRRVGKGKHEREPAR